MQSFISLFLWWAKTHSNNRVALSEKLKRKYCGKRWQDKTEWENHDVCVMLEGSAGRGGCPSMHVGWGQQQGTLQLLAQAQACIASSPTLIHSHRGAWRELAPGARSLCRQPRPVLWEVQIPGEQEPLYPNSGACKAPMMWAVINRLSEKWNAAAYSFPTSSIFCCLAWLLDLFPNWLTHKSYPCTWVMAILRL